MELVNELASPKPFRKWESCGEDLFFLVTSTKVRTMMAMAIRKRRQAMVAEAPMMVDVMLLSAGGS